MVDIPVSVDGSDNFVLGMDSYSQPSKLQNGEYSLGMNLICRGGIAQTRPGSESLRNVRIYPNGTTTLGLPPGNIQGLTFFRNASDISNLVFAIEGEVFVSPYPFDIYHKLENIQFNPNSKYVTWAACIKSTDFDAAGTIYYLDNPYPILIMQDGNTRAAYWDGATDGHINPTPSNPAPGAPITKPGFDGTPIGLWSCWSNNRLWVSRKNQVFASDIGNPLKFTENKYLAEGRAFYLNGNCTGIIETADRRGILCFTSESGTLLQSAIQDRSLWLSTPLFQQTIIPNIGCISPRSIVEQYGLIWWYTTKGLINQDDALNLNITSRLNIQDNEMFQSKFNLSYDLSMVCGSSIENFLFHAVPNGDKLNTRVHMLDQAPFENFANAWPSYWTGWRPVEFARGQVQSQERMFCISYDYDGMNRIWELFKPDKTDNGIPITSFLATRSHYFDNRDWKKFRYAEIEFINLLGPTAVMVAASGTRGAFQTIMVKDVNATLGQMYADSIYGFGANTINGSKPQSRILRTEDGATPSPCNEDCVEYDKRGLIDKGFSLLLVWSGIAGVNAYRLFAQGDPEAYQGICEDDETGQSRILTPSGCGEFSDFSTEEAFTTYYASATFSKLDPDGSLVSKTSNQSSRISQVDANRKAEKMAEWYVMNQIGELV